MVKTLISSKGQTTIPAKFRARWKSKEVIWEETSDGGALVRPVADIMTLFGSAHSAQPRDPKEKEKGRAAFAGKTKNTRGKK